MNSTYLLVVLYTGYSSVTLSWVLQTSSSMRGWAAPKQYNGMLEVVHSCYLGYLPWQGLPPVVQSTTHTSMYSLKQPKHQDPGSCSLQDYIAGDTLYHQPIGIGHMTTPPCLGQWDSPVS